MTRAIIFVCSPNVALQINVAAHLVISRAVDEVQYLMLSDNYATAPPPGFVEEIILGLEELAEGSFGGRPISIKDESRRDYRKTASLLRSNCCQVSRLDLFDLNDQLAIYVDSRPAQDVVVDVSGLTKPQTSAVWTACLFKHLRAYTLELMQPPDSAEPEKSLFHLLGGAYRYPCLTDPAIVEKPLNSVVPRRVLALAVIVTCIAAILCIAGVVILKPTGTATMLVVLWLGLFANVVGVGAGFIQIIGERRSR